MPPSWIIKLPRKGSFKSSLRKTSRKKEVSKKKSKEKESRSFVIKSVPTTKTTPVLVFINPKSGGNQVSYYTMCSCIQIDFDYLYLGWIDMYTFKLKNMQLHICQRLALSHTRAHSLVWVCETGINKNIKKKSHVCGSIFRVLNFCKSFNGYSTLVKYLI